MTREDIIETINNTYHESFIITLPTGFGKSALGITVLKKYLSPKEKVLIVVPRNVLKDNWLTEFSKFNADTYIPNVTLTTYVSLGKYDMSKYSMTIFDEAHHITERCQELMNHSRSKFNVFLSATLGKDLYHWIRNNYYNSITINSSLKNAIEEDILPDPRIILMPLSLDVSHPKEHLIKIKKGKPIIKCRYDNRWDYMRNNSVDILCTEWQYHQILSNDIEYYKKKSMCNKIFKTKWLKLCGDRLKWLSNLKTDLVKDILKRLKDYRTLTFCNGIEQTEQLGKYCINSKNKKSEEFLNMFNNKQIKHITACNILDEGCNLSDCKIGIFANINSSERMVTQKNGRLLRHKEPVIIIPYYKNTREEELVNKMMVNFNPELITKVHTVNEIKI